MKPKQRRSTIYISSQNSTRTVQSQLEFGNFDTIHCEDKSIQSHPHFVADLEFKYPFKKPCATPTLTASLSSSMTNNSGDTVSLEPNRFNDVQHWNADDGPFDISISPSCAFESKEDSEHDHNKVTDSNSQLHGMENGNFEKLRKSFWLILMTIPLLTQGSPIETVSSNISRNALRDESKIKHEKIPTMRIQMRFLD